MMRALSIVLACGCATASPVADVGSVPREVRASSLYVPMRDGVRIAVEVLLPKDLRDGEQLPALLKITRYGRTPPDGTIGNEDRFWVDQGFARVLIDCRGTGASFGSSRFGPAELADLSDLADWVVKQPWSNGRIGAIGSSIEGTAAELLAATGHPAVRAVAPLFSDYNYYTDLVAPGGLFNEWLISNYGALLQQLDAGAAAKPVDPDRDGSLLKQAIAEHAGNPDLYATLRQAESSDAPLAGIQRSLWEIGIPALADALRKARVPMLIFASWYDAGTAQGALQRFRDYPGAQRVYIGAWSHGGETEADPFASAPQSARLRQRQEALAFFEQHLKGAPEPPARQLYYYTVGATEWQATEQWPPAGTRRVDYFLHSTRELATRAAPSALSIDLRTTATGDSNRWRTQLDGKSVDYAAALSGMSSLASFTTPPLAEPLQITGQPILHLQLGCSEPDPSVIAYLIALTPDGRAHYLTEGHLRLRHRKLDRAAPTLHSYTSRDAQPVPSGSFDASLTLLPTSVRLPRGARLQLALASGDRSTFVATREYRAELSSASRLELPVR